MRKVTIHFSPKLFSEYFPGYFEELFETCERVEAKAILKYDLGKGVKIVLTEFHMKPGYTIDDLKTPPELTLLDVLEKGKSKFVCLVKVEYKGEMLDFSKGFDLKNIMFDLPAYLTKEKLCFSFIGDTETIKELLQLIEPLGSIKIDSVQNFPFSETDALMVLTERQQEIITLAKKTGYYDIPRKISTENLSNQLGISKSTLIEHLRKAEKRIVSSLFEGT